jgi:threonine aldolase
MVYISHPTEYGTIYKKDELAKIYAVCRKYSLPLFIDGARLGYGLACFESDMTLADVASLCDVFYIGGTKVGALCGEAVVFTKGDTPKFFTTFVKQHGALLAKGRLLGVQFDTLFTDNLYFEISRRAIESAERMKDIFKEKGYTFFLETPTNQQFILLENEQMKKLSEKVRFCFWEKTDESHTAVRFATSWSTSEEDLCELKKIL